jgi:hypothetical protein
LHLDPDIVCSPNAAALATTDDDSDDGSHCITSHRIDDRSLRRSHHWHPRLLARSISSHQ